MAKRTRSSRAGSPKRTAKPAVKEPAKSAQRKATRRRVAPRAPSLRANIVPCLTYRDAAAAIVFLCEAFGFATKTVTEGEGGTIAHAELTLGNAMIMLGSPKDTGYGRLVQSPRELGTCTQTIYLVVPDPDAHHANAKAHGAEIVLPLTTQDYGGRDYTCRDLEGHVWTFGSYDPWA